MGLFDSKKKEDAKKEASAKTGPSWDDQLAAALPKKAAYFDAIRTGAFENRNYVQNYAEFWVALQVDKDGDKWRVMHYTIFDLDQPDGTFKSENVSKGDMSFAAAVYQLSNFERLAENLGTHTALDFTEEKYPADKYPELQVHFFGIEHFKTAANIEGIAFDQNGEPYRRVDGKVFADATFKRSEVAKSILAVEQVGENDKTALRIEGGILSDIFNSASGRSATLDDVLKVGKALACMDQFAAQVGAFYLGVQKVLDRNEKFEKIQSLTPEDRKAVFQKASALVPSGSSLTVPAILADFLPLANAKLDEAKALGIHVEPFQKHLAECELYAHLLHASQELKELRKGMLSVGGAGADTLVNIQASVKAAQEKFLQLGGMLESFDRLQAWVANDKKETIPAWVSGWLDRYYDQRQKAMKKVQERQAGVTRDVNTLSVKVKPPISE